LEARLSDREIADSLHISAWTVKKHTTNIYQKLQVGSRREAVARATALGLLSGDRVTP
jgi:LuxR family maltose regulon positive regulatory protein